MWEVKEYNRARQLIESRFQGIPHTHSTLIKSLISLADPLTGIVSNISYCDLGKILTVSSAPGRKNTGTPTKQTIRNYIKSIERDCGEHFKVISEGQFLKFFFPDVPKVFSKVFENREVNTVQQTTASLENTEQESDFNEELNIELNTEDNTPKGSVKNIFIYKNINNNNNNTEKKSIADDFRPNAQTIERANALGFPNANDPKEIQDFIAYNQANGSKWADFNPIYLRWLAQCRNHQSDILIANKKVNKDTRRVNDVSQTHKISIRERVLNAWSHEFAFSDTTQSFMPKGREQQSLDWDSLASIS